MCNIYKEQNDEQKLQEFTKLLKLAERKQVRFAVCLLPCCDGFW